MKNVWMLLILTGMDTQLVVRPLLDKVEKNTRDSALRKIVFPHVSTYSVDLPNHWFCIVSKVHKHSDGDSVFGVTPLSTTSVDLTLIKIFKFPLLCCFAFTAASFSCSLFVVFLPSVLTPVNKKMLSWVEGGKFFLRVLYVMKSLKWIRWETWSQWRVRGRGGMCLWVQGE